VFVPSVQALVDNQVVLAGELLPAKGALEALGNEFAGAGNGR